MTWVAAGVVGTSLATSVVGGLGAKRKAKRALLRQQIAEDDQARRQQADFEGQVAAADSARALADEREVLSSQAETEAVRQARLASVETNVDIATIDPIERARRRRAFQEGNAV